MDKEPRFSWLNSSWQARYLVTGRANQLSGCWHIDWLKRYLQNYENAFVLISHDIPFLNDVINIVYHVENQQLTRYSGDYYQFQEVYAMKKSQLEAAYERQQKEIADLKDFVARK